MSHFLTLIKGLVFGAGAMYLLDPEHGAQRRSRLRADLANLTLTLADEADHLVSTSAQQVSQCASEMVNQVVEAVLPERKDAETETLRWSTGTRLLAAAAGGLLVAYGTTKRAPTACLLGTAGLVLLARGATCSEHSAESHNGSAEQPIASQSTEKEAKGWRVATP